MPVFFFVAKKENEKLWLASGWLNAAKLAGHSPPRTWFIFGKEESDPQPKGIWNAKSESVLWAMAKESWKKNSSNALRIYASFFEHMGCGQKVAEDSRGKLTLPFP